ncbi:two-component regulator propeller domain-containing protein [Rhodoflexus sp.]
MRARGYFFFAAWLLISIAGKAQQSQWGIDARLSVNIENGLSHNNVMAVIQDSRQYLWIGTQNGLDCYDGRSIRNFTLLPGKSLEVRALLEDKQQRLWIGTNAGLFLFHRQTEQFTHFQHDTANVLSLADNSIFSLVQDRAGHIWMGTGIGVSRIDPEKQIFFNYPFQGAYTQGLSAVYSITTDADGNIVASSLGQGVQVYSPAEEVFVSYPLYPRQFQRDYVIRLLKDAKGHLWVATLQGLRRIDTRTGSVRSFTEADGLPNNYVASLASDENGRIWAGTKQGGLAYFDDSRWQTIEDTKSEYSLAKGKAIQTLATDSGNILWVGTAGGGLAAWKNEANYFSIHSQIGEVTAMAQQGSNYWAASTKGLFRINSTGEVLERIEKVPQGTIRALLPACDGSLWIANEQGIYIRRSEQWQYLRPGWEGPEEGTITTLFEDSKGRIWVGTQESGLYCSGDLPNQWLVFRHNIKRPQSIADNHIRCIAEDGQGTIWVGTASGGLSRWDGNDGFISFRHEAGNPNSLPHNSIKSLFTDEQGSFWVGTFAGVALWEPQQKHFRTYHFDHVALGEAIQDIRASKGRMWVFTQRTLMQFDRKNGLFVPYRIVSPASALQYTTQALISPEGDLLIGTSQGLVSIRSAIADLYAGRSLPRAFFRYANYQADTVQVQIPLDGLQELTIPYQAANVRISFASPNFGYQAAPVFSYRLSPASSQWSEPTTESEITLGKLAPGNYTLYLRVLGPKGWSLPTELLVRVRPPFWETWWFRLAGTLSLIGLGLVTYRARVRRIEKQNERLERIVEERTAQIANQKNQLERAYHNVRTISEIGHRITAQLHSEQVVGEAFAGVSELVEAALFRIGIYDESSRRLAFYGFRNGEAMPLVYHEIEVGQKRLSAVCFQYQLEIVINDFTKEAPEYVADEHMEYNTEQPLSAIYLPLTLNNKTIGVFTVQSYRRNAYQTADVDFLRALATYLAVAIDNARAYDRLDEARRQIARRNDQIVNSIRYAERIQKAILPAESDLQALFDQFFIWYQPKDIVSGDFYWCHREGNRRWVAVADCTGHGVPGALMSAIGHSILTEIVARRRIVQPAEILQEVHEELCRTLQTDNGIHDDGMDIALCLIEGNEVTFAGAKRPLYAVRPRGNASENRLVELRPNRQSIGGKQRNSEVRFEQSVVSLPVGTMLYLTSDGLADQPNPNREKLGSMAVKELLMALAHLPVEQQAEELREIFDEFRRQESQRDDICIMGIRL